jgi:hypothetical protein
MRAEISMNLVFRAVRTAPIQAVWTEFWLISTRERVESLLSALLAGAERMDSISDGAAPGESVSR